MRNQLTVTNVAASSTEFRIFGPALLPKDMPWPKDMNGQAMLLFVSFPLHEISTYKDVSENLICNVFITYDPINHEHLYGGSLDESCDSALAGAAFIVSNSEEAKIQKRRVVDAPRKLEQELVKGEEPYWLQDEIIIKDMSCMFQLSAVSIARNYPQLDSVFGDEEYYFFLPKKSDLNPLVGRIVVQMT